MFAVRRRLKEARAIISAVEIAVTLGLVFGAFAQEDRTNGILLPPGTVRATSLEGENGQRQRGEGKGGLSANMASIDAATEPNTPPNFYTELYRPQYHFSPPVGNLADPNGLVYFEGEYHLFYQQDGNWAHAVSRDLVHWEHLPIALAHDELGQALSGSVVVDWTDSSGLFGGKPGLVAVYTSTKGGEAQSIAYSTDKGRTWKRYRGNPVIPNPGIKDFRDPKVFWHEDTGRWIMVVSTGNSVAFYRSHNLIDWEYSSSFGEGHGSHVAVWECPDLFRLAVDGDPDRQKWVLHVSVGDNNVTNGSTAQYFIGEFDGVRFKNDNPPETVLITDFGQDFYAAQSFSDIPPEDGRRIWLAWMANWRYPYQSPTLPWKGSMSIPRSLSLRTTEDGAIRLVQEPVVELKTLRATEYKVESFLVDGEYEINDFHATTFEFELVMEWDEVEEAGIRVRASQEEATVIGLETTTNTIFVDRTKAGLEWLVDRHGTLFRFGRRYQASCRLDEKRIKLHGFVDESSIEVFANDGEIVFSNLIYTRPTNRSVELYSRGGSVHIIYLKLYHLRSIWRPWPSFDKLDYIVLSDEYLSLRVGETREVQAAAKPDWISGVDLLVWEVDDPGIAGLAAQTSGRAVLQGLQVGMTRLRVRARDAPVSAEIPVWVVGESEERLEFAL